jgi:hypothetical protein
VDRHVPKRGRQGPSVGQYLLLAAFRLPGGHRTGCHRRRIGRTAR